MKRNHLKHLVCPNCTGDLKVDEVSAEDGGRIESGTLTCALCDAAFPIVRYIPRFVPIENYASGFGLEWTKHARTQYDSTSGSNISETRFFNETKWPHQMEGELILEVGSGSGRFTEQAASTGAMIVSMDYSYAVEANYASNGLKDNVLIVQGDIYRMPFREAYFDKLFCIGVLQHTPRVKESFMALLKRLKSGGSLTVDVYRKHKGFQRFLVPRKYIRPLTRCIPSTTLYNLISAHVRFWWPILNLVTRVPRIRRRLAYLLMIADYRGRFDLPDENLKEWAILDTFDGIAPAYDFPQTLETVQEWFSEASLREVEVQYGYNGIEGRGIIP